MKKKNNVQKKEKKLDQSVFVCDDGFIRFD